jgi:8-oxo-dGTP pyrophosphatase MutT (NUDIX family)
MSGPQSTDGLRIREAARAIVLDPCGRVLLVRFEFPDVGPIWALPGGGLEHGEEHHDAIRRELREECGIVDPEIGPHVWNRLHIIPFLDGLHDGQRERIFLVRVDAIEPVPTLTWAQLNAEHVFGVQWWSVADLQRDVPTVPRDLPALMEALLRDGPPNQPVDIGI